MPSPRRDEASPALIGALLAAALVACTSPKPFVAPQAPAPPPPARWADFEAARGWPSAAPPFESTGHGTGQYRIDVHVAPPYLAPYQGLVRGQEMPVGMVVAAFHRTTDGDSSGSIYVMSKRTPGEWAFFVVDPDGRIVSRPDLELCARCHADAPADHLFGIPRVSTTNTNTNTK